MGTEPSAERNGTARGSVNSATGWFDDGSRAPKKNDRIIIE